MHKYKVRTNAMRMLDRAKIPYDAVEYINGSHDPVDGMSVAAGL